MACFSYVISKRDFKEDFSFKLTYYDPSKNKKKKLIISQRDLLVMEGSDLFKFCAHEKIRDISKQDHQEILKYALKYEVLSELTSFVGILKNKNSSVMPTKIINLDFDPNKIV